jgi:hypothetical protein
MTALGHLRATVAELATSIALEDVPTAVSILAETQARLLARLGVRERAAESEMHPAGKPDRLLAVDAAAERLGVTPRWLYSHSGELPFTHRLSRKALRFSEAGIERFLAAGRRVKPRVTAGSAGSAP